MGGDRAGDDSLGECCTIPPQSHSARKERAHGMEPTPPESTQSADFGLRHGILSPMETLAQSVSTMAPTTTPAATIPLVCALAGNGTWLAYVLATVAVLLVALCIARYARHSASPGSLYTYASMTLPPWLLRDGRVESVAGLRGHRIERHRRLLSLCELAAARCHRPRVSAVLLSMLVTGVSIWIAYRDVKISARLMLWIEAASVTVIVIVVALLLVRHGWHLDCGSTPSARHDRQRTPSRAGAGAVQLCRL